MPMHNKSSLLKVGALALFAAAIAPLAPASASASECSGLPASLSGDPLRTDGFSVVSASKLYRVQERPWSHIPTGARLLVRAPAGVTAADLHRAAMCGAADTSPLAVPGAKLRVERRGDMYELHVTSSVRSAALEIQRRADAL